MDADFTFEDALAGFQRFLKATGYPETIVWVRPADVLLTAPGILYIRQPAASESIRLVQRAFEDGTRYPRGVLLSCLCDFNTASCCYIWVPRDDQEAMEHLMSGGVKYSVPAESSRRRGVAVTSRLRWFWLKVNTRKVQNLRG